MQKFIALLLSTSLGASGIRVDGAISPPSLAIPTNLGSVSDSFHSASDPRLVILIQDLHSHYGVQKNIAALLGFVSDRLPFALTVEGAKGPIDSSVLALFPDQKVKEGAADYLMRQGEISGAEYFGLMRGTEPVGVEDEQYFSLHRNLFRRTLQERQHLVGYLKSIESAVQSLRRKDRRNLTSFEADLKLLLKIADLQATEPDVKAFAPRLHQFLALSRSLFRSSGIQSVDEETIGRVLATSLDYYAMASVRNKPMLGNTLALMNGNSQSNAVLVAGGYHTASMVQSLRRKGISYVVITPTIDDFTEHDRSLYLQRLSGEVLSVRDVLNEAAKGKRSELAKSFVDEQAPSLHPGVLLTGSVAIAALFAGWAHIHGYTLDHGHFSEFVKNFSSWAHLPSVSDAIPAVQASLAGLIPGAPQNPGSLTPQAKLSDLVPGEFEAVARDLPIHLDGDGDPHKLWKEFPPKHKIEFNGVTYYLSKCFTSTAGGRPAFIVYIHRTNVESGEREIFIRGLYKSQSQTVMWRIGSHHMARGWLGKGKGEESTDVPLEIVHPIHQLAARHAGDLTEPKTALFGVLAPGGLEAPAEFQRTILWKTALRNLVPRTKIKIGYFQFPTDPWSFVFFPGFEPDFQNGIAEIFETVSYWGIPVRHYRILSSNREVQYLYTVELAGLRRVEIGSIQPTNPRVTRFGVRANLVEIPELKGGGSLVTPFNDYASQIPPPYRGQPIDDKYSDTSKLLECFEPIRAFRREVLDKSAEPVVRPMPQKTELPWKVMPVEWALERARKPQPGGTDRVNVPRRPQLDPQHVVLLFLVFTRNDFLKEIQEGRVVLIEMEWGFQFVSTEGLKQAENEIFGRREQESQKPALPWKVVPVEQAIGRLSSLLIQGVISTTKEPIFRQGDTAVHSFVSRTEAEQGLREGRLIGIEMEWGIQIVSSEGLKLAEKRYGSRRQQMNPYEMAFAGLVTAVLYLDLRTARRQVASAWKMFFHFRSEPVGSFQEEAAQLEFTLSRLLQRIAPGMKLYFSARAGQGRLVSQIERVHGPEGPGYRMDVSLTSDKELMEEMLIHELVHVLREEDTAQLEKYWQGRLGRVLGAWVAWLIDEFITISAVSQFRKAEPHLMAQVMAEAQRVAAAQPMTNEENFLDPLLEILTQALTKAADRQQVMRELRKSRRAIFLRNA